MSIRVGTVVNIMKAWGTYQERIAYYRSKLAEAQAEGNEKEINYWGDTVKMTEMEMGEFLDVVV